jgi:hypothetical protein
MEGIKLLKKTLKEERATGLKLAGFVERAGTVKVRAV